MTDDLRAEVERLRWNEWAGDFLRDVEDIPGNGRAGGRAFAVRPDRAGGAKTHQGTLS